MTAPISIKHPALRYFGAKFRLAPWIIEKFPPHICYIEVFGGGAGVLLRKAPSYHEIYNDLDGCVVNFFRVLRDKPDELIHAIQLTPYAREEQQLAFVDEGNDIERARRLYVRCWQSHGGGRTQWKSGWRYEISDRRGTKVVDDWNRIEHLWKIVERFKTVQIENDDAINVIQRFDSDQTLFYLDPPYQTSTRSVRWQKKAYTFEIDDDYHKRLAESLHKIKGIAIISGRKSALYDELYSDWKIFQKEVTTDFNSRATENLWISPRAVHQKNQKKMLW